MKVNFSALEVILTDTYPTNQPIKMDFQYFDSSITAISDTYVRTHTNHRYTLPCLARARTNARSRLSMLYRRLNGTHLYCDCNSFERNFVFASFAN